MEQSTSFPNDTPLLPIILNIHHHHPFVPFSPFFFILLTTSLLIILLLVYHYKQKHQNHKQQHFLHSYGSYVIFTNPHYLSPDIAYAFARYCCIDCGMNVLLIRTANKEHDRDKNDTHACKEKDELRTLQNKLLVAATKSNQKKIKIDIMDCYNNTTHPDDQQQTKTTKDNNNDDDDDDVQKMCVMMDLKLGQITIQGGISAFFHCTRQNNNDDDDNVEKYIVKAALTHMSFRGTGLFLPILANHEGTMSMTTQQRQEKKECLKQMYQSIGECHGVEYLVLNMTSIVWKMVSFLFCITKGGGAREKDDNDISSIMYTILKVYFFLNRM